MRPMGTETIVDVLRRAAVRHAYARLYPGLLWDDASVVGIEEAEKAMSSDDVFAAAAGLFCSEYAASTFTAVGNG